MPDCGDTLRVIAIGLALSCSETALTEARPQTPSPPYPYVVEAFAVRSSNSSDVIGGTLTVPAVDSPVPAVILLSVAGPTDRDQSFAGHKGFHVLADHLTRKQIAVARYDDRGVGQSTGDYFSADWSDLADDALRVFAQLQGDARIDPTQIGFVGMSQGGAIGALAAADEETVAFLVLLSAPGLRGVDALERQLEANLEASGASAELSQRYRDAFDHFIKIVTDDPENPDTSARLLDFLDGPGRALVPPYAFLPRDSTALAKVLLGPWYQSNVHFDPQLAYGSLDLPILAVGGDKDRVLPPAAHLSNIERIFQGPTQDITVTIIPGINHIYQDADTGLPQEYATLDSSFSVDALRLIESWVLQQTDDKFGGEK